MSRWAAPRRIGVVSAYVWHVKTHTALSRGDFDEAYRCASAVSPAGQLVTTEDRMIPLPAQRAMAERVGATVAETPASHSVYVSQPQAVADLIKKAAGAKR